MKKTIAIVALAVLATLVVVGVVGNKSDSPKVVGTTLSTESPSTTVTTSSNTAAKAVCASEASTISSQWSSLATTLQSVIDTGASNDPSIVAAAVAAVRRGEATTRNWISSCGTYFPEIAARLTTIMDSLEPMLSSLS